MNNLEKKVLQAFPLARGELWLSGAIFKQLGRSDDPQSHLELCQEMGMTLVSLPTGPPPSLTLDHRYFSPEEISTAAKSNLFVVITVSGPFQRLVDRRGLAIVLAEVGRDSEELRSALSTEAKCLSSLIEEALKCGADAVVIAEDIAYDSATFFSPSTFRDLLRPLHQQLVEGIHQLSGQAYFHSDGNISRLLDDIVSIGFEGLSLQEEAFDLKAVKERIGDSLILLAGLDRDIISAKVLSEEKKDQYIQKIRFLAQGKGLVICSSSGLSSVQEVTRVRQLYELAEEAVLQSNVRGQSFHARSRKEANQSQ
ncbi:MAG: uroporphyrinogen decarboxylase family protein [Chloroflexota bacterium]|nr:uroporphyrinogen decarboxylase family protein [Chloroflexota bacterium]